MNLTRWIYTLMFVGVVLFGALWFSSMPPRQTEAALLFPNNQTSAEAMAIRDELLELLTALKNIQLDTSFFNDPAYLSLIDWSVAIKPQPVGRSNPFLPVGVNE